jgi:hypothetical protein
MPAWATSIVNLEMGKFVIIVLATFLIIYRYFPQILAFVPLKKTKLEEDADGGQNFPTAPVHKCLKENTLDELRDQMKEMNGDLEDLKAQVEAESKLNNERHLSLLKSNERVHERIDSILEILLRGKSNG